MPGFQFVAVLGALLFTGAAIYIKPPSFHPGASSFLCKRPHFSKFASLVD